MNFKKLLAIFLLVLFVVGCLPPESTGKLRGRSQSLYRCSGQVVDAETGKPITGAHVKSYHHRESYGPFPPAASNNHDEPAYPGAAPLLRNVRTAPPLELFGPHALVEGNKKKSPPKVYNACGGDSYSKTCTSFTVTDENGRYRLKCHGSYIFYKAGYRAFRIMYSHHKRRMVGQTFKGEFVDFDMDNPVISLKKWSYEKLTKEDHSKHMDFIGCGYARWTSNSKAINLKRMFCEEAREEMIQTCKAVNKKYPRADRRCEKNVDDKLSLILRKRYEFGPFAGQVLDADSGQSIVGAQIMAVLGNDVKYTETNIDGSYYISKFTFFGFFPEEFKLNILKSGYKPYRKSARDHETENFNKLIKKLSSGNTIHLRKVNSENYSITRDFGCSTHLRQKPINTKLSDKIFIRQSKWGSQYNTKRHKQYCYEARDLIISACMKERNAKKNTGECRENEEVCEQISKYYQQTNKYCEQITDKYLGRN